MKYTAEDRKWSLAVKERDGWTCRRCGRSYMKGDNGLNAAHIMERSYHQTRTDPDNGIALCVGCHSWFDDHKIAGIKWVTELLGQERIDELWHRAHIPEKVKSTRKLAGTRRAK